MINILHIGLSYNCNLKCNHCFVDKKNDNFSLDKIKTCIEYLEKQGLFTIFYTYGEPLLARNFQKTVEFAKQKNIVQILMTNGTMINEKNLEFIKQNINTVYISIDSPYSEEHDKNRGVKGTYNKAINSIKALVKNNVNVGLAVTIREENCNEIYDIIKLAEELDVKIISLLRQRSNNTIIPLPKDCEYFKIFKEYAVKEKRIKILFHDIELNKIIDSLKKDNLINEKQYEKYKLMNNCHIENTISIAPNGDVSKCNLCTKVIDNINNKMLEDIIGGNDFRNECNFCCTKLSK